MTPRAVTWDAVGTLIEVAGSVGLVYAEAAAAWGVNSRPADLDARFPAAFQAAVATWPVPYGADEADARSFWDRVVRDTFDAPLPDEVPRACYDAFGRGRAWRVLPGVRDAVRLVADRGLPQAVVSNFDVRLPALLQDLGLGPFQTVITSAAIGAAKPDPAPLAAAAQALGVPVAEILHIGDSRREDGGLAATGCRVWLVHGGIDLTELEAHL